MRNNVKGVQGAQNREDCRLPVAVRAEGLWGRAAPGLVLYRPQTRVPRNGLLGDDQWMALVIKACASMKVKRMIMVISVRERIGLILEESREDTEGLCLLRAIAPGHWYNELTLFLSSKNTGYGITSIGSHASGPEVHGGSRSG